MKKWLALVMAGLLLLGGAGMAAEWAEGRSAAQPYSGVPEVDLNQTMGYIILYPRAKMPAAAFCDVLEIYLPREDIERGAGSVHLFENIEGEKDPVEVVTVDFEDERSVDIRALSESEMEGLMWGGGTCVDIRLPKSLEFGDAGHSYYVTMDEGCFTAANGAVASLEIVNPEAWQPVLQGEYGVSGLYYAEQPAEAGDEAEDEEADETEPQAPVITTAPKPDDIVTFDLVMGGDAAYAVIYSENDSVSFAEPEYTESGRVTGRVLDEDVDWGIVFLNGNGEVVTVVDLGR